GSSMKVSEAIRLAGTMHAQTRKRGLQYAPDGTTIVASCALVGAAVAMGFEFIAPGEFANDTQRYAWMEWIRNWGLDTNRMPCPECVYITSPANIVVHLNDQHNYTREEIARWLEKSGCDVEA